MLFDWAFFTCIHCVLFFTFIKVQFFLFELISFWMILNRCFSFSVFNLNIFNFRKCFFLIFFVFTQHGLIQLYLIFLGKLFIFQNICQVGI